MKLKTLYIVMENVERDCPIVENIIALDGEDLDETKLKDESMILDMTNMNWWHLRHEYVLICVRE